MTARSTYEASINGIGATATAAALTNENSKQSTLDKQWSVAGYVTDGNASSSSFETAIKTATTNDYANRLALEQARQKTRDAARETLRATGDLGPL